MGGVKSKQQVLPEEKLTNVIDKNDSVDKKRKTSDNGVSTKFDPYVASLNALKGHNLTFRSEKVASEFMNNVARSHALDQVLLNKNEDEEQKEEENNNYSKQLERVQSSALLLDEQSAKEKVLSVQFNLVRSMIPEIVLETFSDKGPKELKSCHFKKKAILALFDIKGFSSYAADLDVGNRGKEKLIDGLRDQIILDLLPKGAPTFLTEDDEDQHQQMSDGKILSVEFHEQCEHAGEQLQQILNRTLHEILICALKSRVDVIKFAGDALLCALWYDDENDQENPPVSELIGRFLQFAKEVDSILKTRKRTFDLHIGISHGTLLCINTGSAIGIDDDTDIRLNGGGDIFSSSALNDESKNAKRNSQQQQQEQQQYSRFEFFVAGNPVVECGRALDNANSSGDICLSEKTYNALWKDEYFRKSAFNDLSFKQVSGGNFLLESFVLSPSYQKKLLNIKENEKLSRESKAKTLYQPTDKKLLTLSSYVPGYARHIISSTAEGFQEESSALSSFGSKRIVSIIFIHIPWLDHFDTEDPDADGDGYLEDCNDMMISILEVIGEYELCLRQFMVDDKGAVAILVAGCPPLTHDDNSTRACFAACSLQMAHHQRLRIGVSTGKTYVGLVGNSQRYEFAVVGDVVNIAARLMNVAVPGQCVCDQATRTFASSSALSFITEGKGVLLKGQTTKSKAFRVEYDPSRPNTKMEDFVERNMHQRALVEYLTPCNNSNNNNNNNNNNNGVKMVSSSVKTNQKTLAEEMYQQPTTNDSSADLFHKNLSSLSLASQQNNNTFDMSDQGRKFSNISSYVISGERGVGKSSLLEWSINASRKTFSSTSRRSSTSADSSFVGYVCVSPLKMKSRLPAWSQLVQEILKYEAGKSTLEKFLHKMEEQPNRFKARVKERVGGQVAIRRCAKTLVRKQNTLSKINLKSSNDFGLLKKPKIGKASLSTNNNNPTEEDIQKVQLLKRRRMETILYVAKPSLVLSTAVSFAPKFGLEPTDFHVLRYLGVAIPSIETMVDAHHKGNNNNDNDNTELEEVNVNNFNRKVLKKNIMMELKKYSMEEIENLLVKVILCLLNATEELSKLPAIVVFDQAELFDEASWSVFSKLCDVIESKQLWNIKILAACTLSSCVARHSCEAVLYKSNVRWLQLSDLTWGGMDKLVCYLFDARQIDVTVSAYLWGETHGNPEKLMRQVELLVTQRLVTVSDHSSILSLINAKTSLSNQKQASADILRKYDRLPRPAQLLLELIIVASIQSPEINSEELFGLFQLAMMLYLPRVNGYSQQYLNECFVKLISTLVVERFISVHKGGFKKYLSKHKQQRRRQQTTTKTTNTTTNTTKNTTNTTTNATGETEEQQKQDHNNNNNRKSISATRPGTRISSAVTIGSIAEEKEYNINEKETNVNEKNNAVQSEGEEEGDSILFETFEQQKDMNGRNVNRNSVIGGPLTMKDQEEFSTDFFFCADPILLDDDDFDDDDDDATDSTQKREQQKQHQQQFHHQQQQQQQQQQQFLEYYRPVSERVKDAIYGSLSDERRCTLHKDICMYYEKLDSLDRLQSQNKEEIYALFAGHCRMSKQPFRCFRYYELASEICSAKGDYINAIYLLKLCCLACIEFEGFLGDGNNRRVIEDELNFEVLLRFGKWHFQIAKYFIKLEKDFMNAYSSVNRACAIFKSTLHSLETSGAEIPHDLFWVDTTIGAKNQRIQLKKEIEMKNKLKRNRKNSSFIWNATLKYSPKGLNINNVARFRSRVSKDFGRPSVVNPVQTETTKFTNIERVKNTLKMAEEFQAELSEAVVRLRLHLTKLETEITFEMNGPLDIERKHLENKYAKAITDSKENPHQTIFAGGVPLLVPPEEALVHILNTKMKTLKEESSEISFNSTKEEEEEKEQLFAIEEGLGDKKNNNDNNNCVADQDVATANLYRARKTALYQLLQPNKVIM